MSSGAKKEKSFNGTKAKFSPNAAVPEKKAEVKLRRKESEKVKQASDPNRKSVLGRFFHNLVDSDDSRKKAAAADAKKKKGRDPVGSDLDLPEHGIMLRNPQTMPRDQQLVPSPRTRAMTLANQGRDNRNRWSSYDIQGCNFTESMLPPTVPEADYSTMGRSQSEETLNALPLADPRSLSKVKDSFITHSNSARQPDTMRKHAQLLQSIQETKADRLSRSDRTIDARPGHSSNGYLLTTEMVIDGQIRDAGVTGINPNQKLNDSQKASSGDAADGNRELRPQNQTASSSLDTLVLLDEKSKQIDKAMVDKRRILSQLFGVAEEDLNPLLEKDVDLSMDLSVRKMILISLLQSDQLTSAISGLLVPPNSGCTDGAVDKEAAAAGDVQSQLLHKVASRLHGHLMLLQQIVDRDAAETNRLKKDLEEAQMQIKMKSMPAEAKQDLPEISLISDSADLSVSTEVQGGNIESLSNPEDNTTESTSTQDTQTMVNIDQNVADNKEKAEEVLPLTEALLNITEHAKDGDDKTDIKLSSDDLSRNVPPSHVDECIETVDAEVVVPNDNNTSDHQQGSVPSSECRGDAILVPTNESVNEANVPAEVKEDYQTDFQDVNDNLEKVVDEADETSDAYLSDSNRKFMNLESIPEDDDILSGSDVEPKVCASENLYQELVVKYDTDVTVEDDFETSFSTGGETHKDFKEDARPVVKDDIQSNRMEDLLPSATDVSSAVRDDAQFNTGDTQSDLENDSLLNIPDNFHATVDVHDAGVSDTSLHAEDDAKSSAADDAQSQKDDAKSSAADDAQRQKDDAKSCAADDAQRQKDETKSSAADDAQTETQKHLQSDTKDEMEASAAGDVCKSHVPVIVADVNLESGDNLENCQELESSTLSEKEIPQVLSRPENLESQEKDRPETETQRDELETDTDAAVEIGMQLEKKGSAESETDGESESKDDTSMEHDVLKLLEPSLFESRPTEESLDLEMERRLQADSENVNGQIPNGSDIVASHELMEVEEISLFDNNIVEKTETAEVNDPDSVGQDLLHNHVESESVERDKGVSPENTKSELSEVVNELLDLSKCDKITNVSSSGRE